MCETETNRDKDIIQFYKHDVCIPMSAASAVSIEFLSSEFDGNFNWKKSQFCQKVPTNTFTIGVDIVKQLSDEKDIE